MRVLHVHSGNLYGGVETFLTALGRCRHMAPSMEMRVALCYDGQIAAVLRQTGVPVTILRAVRLSRPFSVWRARRAFAALLKRERPDIVVCHQPWPLVVFGIVAKRARVPLVLWVHMASSRHWLDRRAWRINPDLVVCNSRFTASTLPGMAANVEVVYAPISSFEQATRASRAETDPAPTNPEVVIIQVGRAEPLKGQTVLLQALAMMPSRTPWVCWQVGGAQRPEERRYLSSLHALAEQLGIADRVRFLGERSDIAELLAQSDIYCQPNVEPEGFGISLIEALAAGIPVVTSAIGGALEIVDDCCGVLVRRRDAASLAVELARLVDDRSVRRRLGANGPARARALCDPAVQIPRIAEVLGNVCSSPRRVT